MKSTSFSLAAQHLIYSTKVTLYALVDGLQYERYFGEGLSVPQPAAMPLFDTAGFPHCFCWPLDNSDELCNGYQ